MGTVFRAFDRASGTGVVLKRLRLDGSLRDAPFIAAFEREYKMLASLDHPHIIRVFDYDALSQRGPVQSELGGNQEAFAVLNELQRSEVLCSNFDWSGHVARIPLRSRRTRVPHLGTPHLFHALGFEARVNVSARRSATRTQFAFHRLRGLLSLYLHFCELDVVFDNTRILTEGVSQPPPLTEYLATCLNCPGGVGIIEQAADEL